MTEVTKHCPFCREEIKANAIRCKHCQAMLAAPPPGTPAPGFGTGGRLPGVARIIPGTEIHECRVKRLLGAGGMGAVYLAEHTYTGQKVALKAVHAEFMEDESTRRRFLEEGRTMAGLTHPCTSSLFDRPANTG